MAAYYFGVESPDHLGHRWYEGGLRPSGSAWRETLTYRDKPQGFPWNTWDGAFYQGRVEGRAELHHKDGWTVLAFEDRSADTRPASNSVFAFEGTLTFDEALAEARSIFPWVWERITFEVYPR